MAETAPETVFDLKTYRQYLLDNSTFTADATTTASLLSAETDFPTFYKKIAPFEKTKYTNQLRFDIPATQFPSLTDNILHSFKSVLDRIAALKEGEHTYANTLGVQEDFDRDIQGLSSSLDFVGHVSPIKELRDASTEAQTRISAFFIAQNARDDVYQSIKAFASTPAAKALTGEEAKFLEDAMQDYRRAGLDLDAEKKTEFVKLKTRLSELCIQFGQNLNEENTSFKLSKDDLKGLSADQLETFKVDEDGKFIVTLKTPDYMAVMKSCQVPQTRALLEKAYNSRCADSNAPLMNEAVQIRTKLAQLLGYKSHSDFVLEKSMAQSPQTVLTFLNDLNTKLTGLYNKDQDALIATKKRVYAELGIDLKDDADQKEEVVIRPYDRAYLTNIIELTEYKVDQEVVKQFFPMEHVTDTMLKFYSKSLGLKFVEVEGAKLYHEDVRLFDVFDTSGVAPSDQQFGQFYLDLYPRDGKYGHAAVFPLVAAYTDEKNGNKRSPPTGALVCNFPKPTATKPSLLDTNSVITYYHEFGHLLHGMTSKTQLSKYAGTSVRRDFVEQPSQLFENIFLTEEFLLPLTKHYQTGEHASIDVVKNIIKADKCQQGSFNKRQLFFGIADQKLHSGTDPEAQVDAKSLFEATSVEVLGYKPTPGTNFSASFGHLMGGYDSFYYGYNWALSLAAAGWDKIKKEGYSDEIFLKFRREVLEKGGSVDPNLLMENFLGQKPTNEAFLISLGCEIEKN